MRVNSKRARIYFFAVIVAWNFCDPFASVAFEKLGAFRKECRTTCHQAEHILTAKKNKFAQAECKACHVGEVAATTVSAEFVAPARAPVIIDTAAVASPSPTTNSMAKVPAGEFVMGSNERWDDEAPEHMSLTGAFYIDLNEVTNADYKKFINTAEKTAPYHWLEGNIPRGEENHPVVYVSWFDANEYCAWVGKRLPNEKEWEKAARGEAGLIYPWGNEWSLDKSNNPYKYSVGTEPVGSYPEGRSPYGLYDMSGNVWEWVDSYYLPHPGNPVMRAEYGADKRVLKGGSWFDCLSYGCGLSAPTFNRSFFTPEVKNNSFGFRCAKNL